MRQIVSRAWVLMLLGWPVAELHAGFIGSSCFTLEPATCSSTSPDSGAISPASLFFSPDGAVTYTYSNTFNGFLNAALQPNLLTSAYMDVTDSLNNPVPSTPQVQSQAGETYTDIVGVSNPGSQITFNFSLAVNNTANSNFDEILSFMQLSVTGYDASNNEVFSQEWFSPNVSQAGASVTDLAFTTGPCNPFLYCPNISTVATLDINLNLQSQVFYSNYLGNVTASDTGPGSSDASHTLIFESIQSGNATFTSYDGADYNASTPEPGTWALAACGSLAAILRRRRR